MTTPFTTKPIKALSRFSFSSFIAGLALALSQFLHLKFDKGFLGNAFSFQQLTSFVGIMEILQAVDAPTAVPALVSNPYTTNSKG